MKKLFPLILLVLIVSASHAQRSQQLLDHQQQEWTTFKEFIRYDSEYIPDTNIDVTFYCIDLYVAIDSPYIDGVVICRFEPLVTELQQIQLSLHKSLRVSDVDGHASAFSQIGDSIMIDLDGSYGPGDQLELFIHYAGVPVLAGGYKGLRYETHNINEPIIATLSTPYLAHYWYPCKDGPSDKADSVCIDITIPVREINGVEVIGVSNGILEGVIDNGDTKTYMWRHRYPVVPYYVMIAISNYVHFGEEYTGMYGEQYPLDYYVFQDHLPAAQNGIADLPLALDVFSEKFGEYPFSDEKYGMTQLGFYGAIENQTNTIQNNLGEGWYMVSVHELAHMWFGDMITCRDWHHGWLNEGFASYLEAVYVEAVEGTEAYHDYVEDFEFYNGGTLYLQNANDTFNVFQSIIYNKGAYTLHMLRGALGDEAFWNSMYEYSTDTNLMYAQAVTEDLQQICEEVSGEDLEYFFEQWIYDEYYPEYDYNFKMRGDSVDIAIQQIQEQQGRRPLFEMPMDIKLSFGSNDDTTIRVLNDQIYQVYTVAVEKEVYLITPDPDDWILCKKNYKPDLPVGLNDNALQEIEVHIYPNPATAYVNINIEGIAGHANLFLYDLKGKAVVQKTQISNGSFSLNLEHLPAGVYIYVLKSEQGDLFSSEKIILK